MSSQAFPFPSSNIRRISICAHCQDLTKSVNEETLQYALERGWINEGSVDFYSNTLTKRKTSNDVENIMKARQNVNRRLLDLFKGNRKEAPPARIENLVERARAACSEGAIQQKDLQFLTDVAGQKYLTEGQVRYRESLESRILGEAASEAQQGPGSGTGLGGIAEEPAKRRGVENVAYEATPEEVRAAFEAKAISQWELERALEWRDKAFLTEKQMEWRNKIEAKVCASASKSAVHSAAAAGPTSVPPAGASADSAAAAPVPVFGVSADQVAAALASKFVSQWESDRFHEWSGRAGGRAALSAKQEEYRAAIEGKVVAAAGVVARVAAARSAKKINDWEKDRFLEWSARLTTGKLSDKQQAVMQKIEKKMGPAAQDTAGAA